MKMKELVESCLIKDKDKDKITVSKKSMCFGYDIRKGRWFNDNILDWMDEEVRAMSYDEESGWSIALK